MNDNAVFAADKLAQFRDAPLYLWLVQRENVLHRACPKFPQPEPNPDAPSPMPQIPWDKALAASGAMGLKSASFAYRESAEGSQVNF